VDLSPGQKRAVFAVIVLVLVGLGLWLILPKTTSSHAGTTPTASPTPTASAPVPAATVTQTPASTTVSPGTGVDIYSWLPFTQQGLTAAAAVTVKFCAAYNTFTYTESASAYVASMNGLVTPSLADSLKGVYSAPGVAALRTSQQQVSTGGASISSLRAFGDTSLTFVVTGTQHLASTKGTSNGSTQYAVTVTGSGTSWQVNDIELASQGNS
jgi:hypothetical protein